MRQVQSAALVAILIAAASSMLMAQATTEPAPAAPAPVATAAATSRPATVPVEINTGTPRGTLKVLAKAMETGDAALIKSVLYATNPMEEKMAGAMADMADALAKLRTAAQTAFGKDGAKKLHLETSNDMEVGMARIDAANESIEGDTAQIRVADAPPDVPAMVLKKIDGVWKLPMGELSKGTDPNTVDERLEEVALQTRVISEAAAEFSAGKYKTPEEAADGLQGKMMRAAMQHAAAAQATTKPTTDPAGPPAPTTAPAGL